MKDVAAREGLVAIGYERKFGEFSRLYQFAKVSFPFFFPNYFWEQEFKI